MDLVKQKLEKEFTKYVQSIIKLKITQQKNKMKKIVQSLVLTTVIGLNFYDTIKPTPLKDKETVDIVEQVITNDNGIERGYAVRQMNIDMAKKYQNICRYLEIDYLKNIKTLTENQHAILKKISNYKIRKEKYENKYKRCDIVSEPNL